MKTIKTAMTNSTKTISKMNGLNGVLKRRFIMLFVYLLLVLFAGVCCSTKNTNVDNFKYSDVHIIRVISEARNDQYFVYDDEVTIYHHTADEEPTSVTVTANGDVYFKDNSGAYAVTGVNSNNIVSFAKQKLFDIIETAQKSSASKELKVNQLVEGAKDQYLADRIICYEPDAKVELIIPEPGSHISVPRTTRVLTLDDLTARLTEYGYSVEEFGLQ